jgi:protein gp37
MSSQSSIEWTNATWNPMTGCTPVSAGCDNCYAATLAARLQKMGSPRYRNGFKLTLQNDLVELPKKWKAPRKIFVNSMSDLYHKDVPTEFIERIFETMNACPQHQFQILTKRPQRMATLAKRVTWTPNIWQGVSIEDNNVAWRADYLRKVPAAVRFLSIEPLIGPADEIDLKGIDWVIVGGESGSRHRPMKREWAAAILKKCRRQEIPFFFKQWGGRTHSAGGNLFDGRLYQFFPTPKARFPQTEERRNLIQHLATPFGVGQ